MPCDSARADRLRLWRQHVSRGACAGGLSIGLAGSFTLGSMASWLGGALLERGLSPRGVAVGPFNQLHQVCRAPLQELGLDRLDCLAILWRLEDLAPDMLERFSRGEAELRPRIMDEVEALLESVSMLRKAFDGGLIVSTTPYPESPSFDPNELEQPMQGGALFYEAAAHWLRGVSAIEGVGVFDLHALLSRHGYARSHDARKWYLYKQPYTEEFSCFAGEQLARLIAARSLAAKKCLVTDCDHTLWGGVIGEDGLSGIELGFDFPGSAYRDYQQQLLRLRSKGVLLAVASKNNPDDVMEVFEKHDAMLLKKEHVCAFEVHWESKVESLRRIAAALNIGLDSLVFVDNDSKEIAEARQRLPEVVCLQAPEDPAGLRDIFRGSPCFDLSEITQEDRRRADMMAAERRRGEARSAMSEAEFLASLDLEVQVFQAGPAHIARIAQLVNKTNQFNLTSIRRTQDQVAELARSPRTLVLGMQVRDRFGDHGLVGVAIACGCEGSDWQLDTLLMSCRVLGRGVESALVSLLCRAVAARGGARLIGEYRPSAKNAMVSDLLQRQGFAPEGARWALRVDEARQPPGHMRASLELPAEGS